MDVVISFVVQDNHKRLFNSLPSELNQLITERMLSRMDRITEVDMAKYLPRSLEVLDLSPQSRWNIKVNNNVVNTIAR